MLTNAAKYIVLLIWLLLAYLVPTHGQQAVPANEDKLKKFIEIAETLRKDTKVPGAGIAIVVDNQLIYTGGLGHRDIARKLPVTKDTLFAIGSATKAFTGVIASKLVAQKKLRWNEPIVSYYPDVKFSNDYLTRNVNIKDLLSHTTGVGRYDLVWYGSDIPRDELMKRIRFMDTKSSLRGEFGYNNVMFVLAGVVQEKASGKSWDTLIREEIFKPLGMTDSYTTYKEFMSHPRKSIGYGNDRVTPVKHRNVDNIAPAGSITSTPADMGKWLLMLTQSGKYKGKDFLSKKQFEYLTTPKLITHTSEFGGYAIGWGAGMRNGSKIMSHDGGIDGQNSYTYVRPDLGFGIVVMTNNRSEYKRAIARYAENIFLRNDYSRDLKNEESLRLKSDSTETFSNELGLNDEAGPTFTLKDMLGTFSHPAYGRVEIQERSGERLYMIFNRELQGYIKHQERNRFRAHIDPDDLPWSLEFEFNGNKEGEIVAFTMKADRQLKPAVFKKLN